MKTLRLQQMEQYILDNSSVSMDELCKKFNVSINTVRQDVATLVDKGTVRKIYGGVCSNQTGRLVPFEDRRKRNMRQKTAIGKLAASFIEDGDIVYLDSGTTTMYVAEHIDPDKSVTILTTNLNAINAALPHPNLDVICLPGRLNRKINSFVSADTQKVLERYNVNLSFMAATGLSTAGAVTNSSLLEYEVKRATVKKGGRCFLMVDSSKYGKTSLLTYADLSQFYCVLTDEQADPSFLALCEERGVPVHVAPLPEK